ncbi:C3a anaphylatoxin chemotactic receptor-like [Eleutherodactylus coqui]|uniref:C3a anaphylatoxin chemotactic receptor-like n=1 Tax=Eleutherodactylus coqui TaxID=57060 RepID=UPI003462163F
MEIHNLTKNFYNYTDYFYYDDFINIWTESYFSIYWFLQILSITCYSITTVLGLAGNALVIWISGFKMKTVSSVWFLNLAIVDFISCICLVFRVIQRILELHSIYIFFMCTISFTALLANMVTSVHFLIVISLDRCISVMWPLWAKVHRTRRMAFTLSGFMWLLNIIIFILPFIFEFDILSVSECSLTFYTQDRIRYRILEDVAIIVRNIFIFAIPFLTIFVSYGLIVLKLKTLRRRQSPRTFMIIVAILISFFVCWFPYHAWSLMSLTNIYSWKTDLIISEISTILACFNCAINPILYVFLGKDFKNNFVKSIPKRVEIILSDPGDFIDGSYENDTNNRTKALDTSV